MKGKTFSKHIIKGKNFRRNTDRLEYSKNFVAKSTIHKLKEYATYRKTVCDIYGRWKVSVPTL
jgi:hypothetical protein